MEAAPGDDEQTTRPAERAPERLPARITLGWPFFSYQLPLKGLLVVAGAAAVVMIAAAFILLSTTGSGATGVVELQPFRLEGSLVQTHSGDELRSTAVMEWQDARHYRNTTTTEGEPPFSATIMADGEWRWLSGSESPTYTRSAIPEIPFGAPTAPLLYMLIGPMTGAKSLDDLLDELSEQREEFGPGKVRYARVVGQETYLGIPATVIEYGPLWNDSSPEKLANDWTINTGGSAKMWLDPETMIILRSEAEFGEEMTYLGEVTALEFDPEFAPGTFEFVPPPGKTEVIE